MSLLVLTLPEIELAPDRVAAWLAELPAARQHALQHLDDRVAIARSVLGSRLLRVGLPRFGHAVSALQTLSYPASGKPQMDLPLDFSISHCQGLIVCALSDAGPVGVDVEPLGPLSAEAFTLYLGAAERAWAGADPLRFYTLWTQKEAVIKAAGLGLRELGEVRIEGEQAFLDGGIWETQRLPLGEGYIAHLAGRAPLPAARVEPLTAEMLL